LVFHPVIYPTSNNRIKQGVALTGRNTTGPPRAAVSYIAYAGVTDDDRRQQPLLVWHPYTMCRWASNKRIRKNKKNGHRISQVI